ncbi:3,4-dioxygenase subunit beta [Nocardioides flavescens]|uniref:3,4-dioxygenase subunit beta n=1 Tax=Nocardioides flavescens TaxID=2691959 RepID=A0A6L7F351_9ACTN|nr:3,4-dioxygenase subunit beta [Nocardioides flavescens]MXG91064.1 3,4-dioxygenase subunit beta [Nocardioides flavescens]
MSAHEHDHDHDEHREGLSYDLPQMQERGMVRRTMGRRGLLGVFGGLGAAAALAACGSDDTVDLSSSSTSSSASSGAGPGGTPPDGGQGGGGSVSQEGLDDGDIPEETAGPYPGDGSNGVDVLSESGIVRQDIRSSFGDATGVAEGVPMTINLAVYDNSSAGMSAYAGAAVYLWHCDRDGNYSLYSDGITEENYLRGVQEVAADGTVSFTSIFPACYSGRWPHLHFEVYPSIDDATSASGKLRTSQIAMPQDVCDTVYGTAEGYEQSVSNFAQVSLDSDNVFSDGHSLQMATLTGSVDEGYTLALNVPV